MQAATATDPWGQPLQSPTTAGHPGQDASGPAWGQGTAVPPGRQPARRAMPGLARRSGADTPWLTYAIIAICAVVYVLQWMTSADRYGITQQFWYAGAHTSALEMEPYRMLTSAFLHSLGTPMHILFNMFTLWMIGQTLEPALGRVRFLTLYLVSALGGSVAVLWLSEPTVPVVGASGAVYGLFAALFMVLRATGGQVSSIVALIVVNLVISFMGSNISWQGHIGGLVTGAAVAAAMTLIPRGRPAGGPGSSRVDRGVVLQWAAIAGIVVVLVVLTAIGAARLTPLAILG
ncbi:rhomboid family intramembrane serine protease [Micrococcus terreus]|uniref:rhomboid family intramembrane serine protease n=1 Tax=Micrococcus terreus TaxID=574650 RepID=UPI002954B6DD|nr:rhomboid family intramembrane serine protease [Micrococcus terreus]MDK7700072.1 rhomboid family intramembrane serine protease [Micrococcus terreus]WOO97061.1 rhomboid family intramembrane serine protease [Micrococcus terreus]